MKITNQMKIWGESLEERYSRQVVVENGSENLPLSEQNVADVRGTGVSIAFVL